MIMKLEDKILRGYRYTFYVEVDPEDETSRSTALSTGVGGTMLIIEELRKKGMSDGRIEELIFVDMEEHGTVCLKHLKLKE